MIAPQSKRQMHKKINLKIFATTPNKQSKWLNIREYPNDNIFQAVTPNQYTVTSKAQTYYVFRQGIHFYHHNTLPKICLKKLLPLFYNAAQARKAKQINCLGTREVTIQLISLHHKVHLTRLPIASCRFPNCPCMHTSYSHASSHFPQPTHKSKEKTRVRRFFTI